MKTKIKKYSFFILFPLITISCKEDGSSLPELNEVRVSKQEFKTNCSERIKLVQARLMECRFLQGEQSDKDTSFFVKYHAIYDMLTDLKAALVNNEKMNFDIWKDIFISDPFFEIDFWKDGNINIDEAIILVDKLVLIIRESDYCNNFYVFENLSVSCNLNDEDVGLFLKPEIEFIGYYLGSKDSVDNFNYLEKQKIIRSNRIVIKDRRNGVVDLEGGVLVKALNRVKCIPFEVNVTP